MASSRLERIGTIFTRKSCNSNLLKGLSEITNQIEVDYNAMKDNEQKLEQLTATFMKCIQQATTAYKHKFKALKELQTSFKNVTQGLISKGGMKGDDRPIWFDVYRAFPPHEEPNFARPKPQDKPITQILYKEDLIRAKLQARGVRSGGASLVSRGAFVQQYEGLRREGLTDEEIVERLAAAPAPAPTPATTTDTHTQLMADADLTNIFKQ